MSAALALVWRFLRITLPVPLALVIALAAWWQIDKTSAVRRAVVETTQELVAGSRIAALEAERDAQARIAAAQAQAATEANRRAQAYLQLHQNASAELARVRDDAANLQDDLDELLAAPPPPDCTVGPGLAGRLRGR